MIRKNIFLFFVLSCIMVLCSCAKLSDSGSSYKIAVIAPQSGPYSLLGGSIIMGAELAVNEINANGGIGGRKVLLIKEDDGGLVGEGAFFAYRLTRTEMLLGVIGHLNSDISIPASDFYARAKIPQISPGSTSPHFTERNLTKGFVFRTIGRDDVQGKLLADYVIKHGLKRVAILYNDRAYGKMLAGEFDKSLKSARVQVKPQVVFYEMIEIGKKDYGALLSRISTYKPDAIFLAGEHDDAGNLVRDFKKYGLSNTQFLGGDGIDNTEFIKLAGSNSEGAVVISPSPIVDNNFVEKYKKAFNEEPTGYAANSFDAANILINAIKNSKVKDSENVAKEIASTKDFKGATGSISFNEHGDLTSPGFVLSRVKGGKFIIVDQ